MAFAAVVSLKHAISNPNNDIKIPKSSHQALGSLCSTLKRLDDKRILRIDMSVIYALEAEIIEAAYKLEDTIQYYLFHRPPPASDNHDGLPIPASDNRDELPIPCVDLDELNQQIDLFFKRVKTFEEDCNRGLHNLLPEEEKDDDVSPTQGFGGNESTTVGLSDQIEKITKLLRLQSGPKFVSLVGMAGIGKTQIAREIARHPRIVQHFDFIAWVSVGSKRQTKDVAVDIVAQIEGKPRNLFEGKNTNDLLDLLRKKLDIVAQIEGKPRNLSEGKNTHDLLELLRKKSHKRSYLIVLDDVWCNKVTRFLRNWLRDEGDGSRVLLTTRVEEVAEGDSNGIRQIRFMNSEESWNLLRQKVFAETRYCSPQLEKVGRKIAEKCEGLPLLILAIARILCKHEQQTEEFWKAVAEEKNSTFTDAYDEISKVLHPSYEFLPQNLKACFLYMAVFPQRYEITFIKLLHLWIAEEFYERGIYEPEHVVPCTYLENFTMECLEKLVSHSVVIICKHSSTERIKSCKLHSAFWHLCTKEARKINLFHVLKRSIHAFQDDIESQRRLSVQNNILFGIKEVYESIAAATLTARSLLCTGPYHEYEVPVCLDLVLLKVLDAAAIRFYDFPVKVVKLVRLKYLALTHHGKLPSSISDLQQLQCLIIRHHHSIRFVRDVDSVCLPKEMRDKIRDLPDFRSVKLRGGIINWAKQMWEKIYDVQQLRMSGETPSFNERHDWMFDLLEYSSPFCKENLLQIKKKMSAIQKACGTYSIDMEKEIWEEVWGIQEMRISDKTFLPKEIWEMQQLRHLRIIGRNLPHPSNGKKLPNLSTLYVDVHSCNSKVFKSLPSLKKLGIIIEAGPFAAEIVSCFKHISLLEKLESLKCVVVNPQPVFALAPVCRSHWRLKKLSLSGLAYGRGEFLSEICYLRELEVLKLRCAEFQETEWETKVGEFPSLKYLLLEDVNLVRWTIAYNGCFPKLQRLIIRHCYKLKELPLPRALKMIELVDCSPSLVASAERARSSSVEVLITSSWKLPR